MYICFDPTYHHYYVPDIRNQKVLILHPRSYYLRIYLCITLTQQPAAACCGPVAERTAFHVFLKLCHIHLQAEGSAAANLFMISVARYVCMLFLGDFGTGSTK